MAIETLMFEATNASLIVQRTAGEMEELSILLMLRNVSPTVLYDHLGNELRDADWALYLNEETVPEDEIESNIGSLTYTPRREAATNQLPTCSIPDDCIDSRRYPLFMARAVMRELIEQLKAEGFRS